MRLQAGSSARSPAPWRRSAGGRAPPPGSGRRRPGARAMISPKRAAPAGVERAQRLVQQPERPGRGEQAGQRQAAPLAGGQPAHLQVQQAASAPSALGRLRRGRRSPPPVQRLQKPSSSRAVRAGFSPSWWPSRCRPARRAPRPARRRRSRSRRPPGRTSPATARSRLVLPAPFGAGQRAGLAGLELSDRPAEQPPAAAADGDVREFAGARSCGDPRPPGSSARAWTRRTLRSMKRAAAVAPGDPRRAGTGRCVSALRSARSPGRSWCGREQREDLPNGVCRQPENPPRARGGRQDLRLLQPSRRRGSRTFRHLAPAGLDEGAAREPAAQRGRPVGRPRRPARRSPPGSTTRARSSTRSASARRAC